MRTAKNGLVFLVLIGMTYAAGTLTVQCGQTGIPVSPLLYGIFFEELQHAGEGGAWGELVQNRTFEGGDRTCWSLFRTGSAAGTLAYETGTPLHTAQPTSGRLTVTAIGGASDRIGIANAGFWGMNIVSGSVYTLTFYARASSGYAGSLRATLESSNGATIYATQTITGLTTGWQKFTATLTPTGSAAQGRLAITSSATGSVWFDVVSLFPPSFKNRPNGLRRDLANMLDSIHPKFVRFPGGTYVEGATMADAFRWKRTIGDPITRPGHNGNWGYWSTDGLGYLEYLQMAEDFGAEPLFVINCGMAHNSGAVVPLAQMGEYVQDALDAIEYANGDTTTTWGALRKAHGHPAPFNMKYIEIGNEAYFQIAYYRERYPLFYNAIHAAYPAINIISNAESWDLNNNPVDWVDHHNYYNPNWGWNNTDNYAGEPRTGRKIFLGEYMACDWVMPSWGLLLGAVSDGAYLTGIERNSDIVKMACAAPLLCNLSLKQWGPNCLYFNSSAYFGSPQYYVQKMYSNNVGNFIVPTSFSITSPPIRFNATKVTATGELIIKLVNVTATADPITITLAGAATPPSTGTALVLASATNDTNDGNSITQPTRVVPASSNITGLGLSFGYTVRPWSVNVLRLGWPTAVMTGDITPAVPERVVSGITMRRTATGIALVFTKHVNLPVAIAIYSLKGNRIAEVVDVHTAPGTSLVPFNIKGGMSSSAYLVHFTAGRNRYSQMCVLSKR
ncbi:MAG: carbohydrate binding domain-containing protein [Chitinispirillaceae bacterium]|nr:carbohydrate binding domain-containing protein [Chitinispirillaceae bacterium]